VIQHPLLGERVRDTVTGIVGVAVGRCEHLNGSPRVQIQPPPDSNGCRQEPYWTDEDGIDLVAPELAVDTSGGPVSVG